MLPSEIASYWEPNTFSLNRLTQATGNYGAEQSAATLAFAYAVNGNITQKDNKTYTYNTNGTQPHAVRGVGSDTFDYDLNGNMTSRLSAGVITNYTYDRENRLNAVKNGAVTRAQYAYDDTGARIRKTADSLTTSYVDEIYEKDNTTTRSYIFIGGQRVALLTPAQVNYYHSDHLGSTNVVTNSSGTVIDTAEYKPFGEFSKHTSYGEEGYYFTDQYRDAESDLYYYGARYYDSQLARFMSPDSIVQTPRSSQSLNRYSYVWNNPVKLTDPSGNFAQMALLAYTEAVLGSPDLQTDVQQMALDIGRSDYASAIMDAIGIALPGVSATAVKGAAKFTTAIEQKLLTWSGKEINISKGFVQTPHGIAVQETTPEALSALEDVIKGNTVYRQGQFGIQNTADAQFWGITNPAVTNDFANKLGMPATSKIDWMMGGTVNTNSNFITRSAPGLDSNEGGFLEAVTEIGGIRSKWFHMP